jgi:putative heme-binding domain-containing protein
MRTVNLIDGVPDAASRIARLARAGAACAALVAAAMATAAPPVVNTEPLAPEQQREKFKLPAGFAIELVAAEPQIQKPMNMAFDARGRLWVTHSVEYPFAAAAGTKPRDGLTILEDFGPDGRARKATLFADELNIPIGVLPLPVPPGGKTAAIVWSIPNIWKVTDTDGDGQADLREVLYGPFDCVDTHGNQNAFRLGADGWVYANHGFRNQSRVKLRGVGDVVLHLNSGNTYRFRPDGSAIEHVTSGQTNPFGMCFDALGNRFNADCHSSPLTMLLPGANYPGIGAPAGGLGVAPAITADAHGSTGIGAVAIAETDRVPDAYRGDVFIGNVVNCLVHRDRIEWRGSSPWVQKPDDFLTCEDLWFRPADLQLGPDGALYVADFYNCIIGHYEVDLKHPRRDRHRGRIWRVVWKGEPGAAPAGSASIVDLTKLPTPALAERLADPNETVRRLAMEQLVERGRTDATVVGTLQQRSDSEHRRARALRALALLDRLEPAAIAAAGADESRLVRVHLVKALEALPGWDESRAALVRGRLTDADPFVRRAAAEALAAHPAIESVEPLLRCWAAAPAEDVQLVHAVRIALRKHLVTATPEQLAGLVATGDDATRLVEIMAAVPGEFAAWRAFELVRGSGAPVKAWSRSLDGVAARCGDARIDEAARAARAACGDDLRLQEELLQPMLERVTQSKRPIAAEGDFGRWAAAYSAAVLADGVKPAPSDSALRLAVSAVKRQGVASAFDAVMRIARDAKRPPDLIESAAAAAVAADRDRALALALPLIGEVSEPYPVRIAFARVLGNEDSPEVRAAIGRALKPSTASQQKELAMVLLSRKEGAGLLLELIGAGKASALLLQDRQVLERLGKAGVVGLDERIQTLTAGMPAADKRIQQAILKVAGQFHKAGGAAETGAELFTKHCAACHRFADRGGLVGPQLEGIGQRGAERLLEDILDPNRNVDEAFRTTTVALADGRVISGLRLREEAADVVFADATGKEVRVSKGEIEETNTSRVSPMPANMLDQVGEGNLPHLLAYLLRQQAPAAP